MPQLPPSGDPRRLRLVNALFARVTGDDLYLARQIKEAIAFSLTELEEQMRDRPDFATLYDDAFGKAAARLVAEYFKGQTGQGFFHWDASRTLSSPTPLFARAELMEGIKRLSPYAEATLLITNLRPALIPHGIRVTPRREREYEELLTFIRDLAAARIPSHVSLQILFL